MPLDLQVIQASEFVCLDPHEHLDFEASKQALRTLAQACRKRGLDRALVDLRSLPVLAKPHFSKTELAALVLTFREAGFTQQQRLAALYRHDVFGGIRDFAFISRLRGLQVLAFSDFEAALKWLSDGPESQEKSCQGAVDVPITQAQRALKSLPLSLAVRSSKPAPHHQLHKSR